MGVRPSMEVVTEVGTIEVSCFQVEDNFFLRYKPWHEGVPPVMIDWLDREDVENLAQACRLLLDMCDRLPREDVA